MTLPEDIYELSDDVMDESARGSQVIRSLVDEFYCGIIVFVLFRVLM